MREAEHTNPLTLVTTAESARILDCVPDNVRKLARTGQLPVVAVVGRGQRLFDREQVKRFAEKRRTRQR